MRTLSSVCTTEFEEKWLVLFLRLKLKPKYTYAYDLQQHMKDDFSIKYLRVHNYVYVLQLPCEILITENIVVWLFKK